MDIRNILKEVNELRIEPPCARESQEIPKTYDLI